MKRGAKNYINNICTHIQKHICKMDKNKFNKGDKVTIKGYKKTHIIESVYIFSPPKCGEEYIYRIDNTNKNKRYLEKDLQVIKA